MSVCQLVSVENANDDGCATHPRVVAFPSPHTLIPCPEVRGGVDVERNVGAIGHGVRLRPVENIARLCFAEGDLAAHGEHITRVTTDRDSILLLDISDHANAVPAGRSDSTPHIRRTGVLLR